MPTIGESLKNFWLRYGMKLRLGASEVELREFEGKYNVLLPDDLKDYFLTVDGSDLDENVIEFLRLAEVVPLSQTWSHKPEADSYFVFADYSISCHVYAIRLTKDLTLGNPVFIAYDENPKQIADSFSEFVQGYLADDYGVLFPQ
jgi:hypothetical protein